jgi:hypothetical protein
MGSNSVTPQTSFPELLLPQDIKETMHASKITGTRYAILFIKIKSPFF